MTVDNAAVADQRRRVAADPHDVIARHNLGVELRKTGRTEEALVNIERALSLGATAAETATVHAHLLADRGRFDAAIAAYHRVLNRHPAHLDAHETLARLLPQIGRRAEAFDAYRRALALAPHIGMLWISALSAAKDLRDADQLLGLIAAAEARFGTEPFLAVLAAQAYSWQANDKAAFSRLAPAIAAEPENAGAQATLAQLHIRSVRPMINRDGRC
jgi:tetratricopeptide (TPR) repeat protein